MIQMIKALKGTSLEMGSKGTLVTCGPFVVPDISVPLMSRDMRKSSMVN